jgi:hypothetical protein
VAYSSRAKMSIRGHKPKDKAGDVFDCFIKFVDPQFRCLPQILQILHYSTVRLPLFLNRLAASRHCFVCFFGHNIMLTLVPRWAMTNGGLWENRDDDN